MVELWVELGWNYMKFHPNSTYNSTYFILLIFNVLSMRWWNGGITFSKFFFSVNYGWKYVKKCENILISLQNRHFLESFQCKVAQY